MNYYNMVLEVLASYLYEVKGNSSKKIFVLNEWSTIEPRQGSSAKCNSGNYLLTYDSYK